LVLPFHSLCPYLPVFPPLPPPFSRWRMRREAPVFGGMLLCSSPTPHLFPAIFSEQIGTAFCVEVLGFGWGYPFSFHPSFFPRVHQPSRRPFTRPPTSFLPPALIFDENATILFFAGVICFVGFRGTFPPHLSQDWRFLVRPTLPWTCPLAPTHTLRGPPAYLTSTFLPFSVFLFCLPNYLTTPVPSSFSPLLGPSQLCLSFLSDLTPDSTHGSPVSSFRRMCLLFFFSSSWLPPPSFFTKYECFGLKSFKKSLSRHPPSSFLHLLSLAPGRLLFVGFTSFSCVVELPYFPPPTTLTIFRIFRHSFSL